MDNNQNQSQNQPKEESNIAGSIFGDMEKDKALAIIGYIVPILFFLPFIADSKASQFARFHARQQLNFLLFLVIGYIGSFVLMIVLVGFLLYFVVSVCHLVFLVLGVINSIKGKMKPLPWIGNFKVLE